MFETEKKEWLTSKVGTEPNIVSIEQISNSFCDIFQRVCGPIIWRGPTDHGKAPGITFFMLQGHENSTKH